jgi:tRNA A37 threonylcarbamoyltransferase TsaD
MIVIGVDVHKQSLTAVAVDEAGRMLDEKMVAGSCSPGLAGSLRSGCGRSRIVAS